MNNNKKFFDTSTFVIIIIILFISLFIVYTYRAYKTFQQKAKEEQIRKDKREHELYLKLHERYKNTQEK